jgi:DUF4097 and DUF4098 domain-containing protein YvlB
MRIFPAVIVGLSVAIYGPALAHAADASFHRSLNVNGNVTLNVCTSSGDIHVFGVDGNTIQISGNVHSASTWHSFGGFSSPVDIKKIADNPPIQQTGSVVNVGNHETCNGSMFHSISIDYEISLPRNATVAATSGSGDLHVENIGGFLHAETGSGNIRTNITGNGADVETGSGSIAMQNAHGPLKAHSGSGDITVRDSELGDSQLGSGSGDIVASDVHGSLKAGTGSGGITITGFPTSNWKLDTGSGSIHFHADPNAKFTLDAESSSGDIDSKLPITISGHIGKKELRGPVNGGGPVVKMYTGSGDITLQ